VSPLTAPSLRILVVEDDASNQTLAKRMLHALGFAPDFASDGSRAVEAAKDFCYDLIFMDLQMPVLDGIAAAVAIREWEKTQRASAKPAKIVALTANVSQGDRDRCAQAGMDGFLGKPINLQRLRAVLEHIQASAGEGRSFYS
jgi:CheY-like chemotaxis protein